MTLYPSPRLPECIFVFMYHLFYRSDDIISLSKITRVYFVFIYSYINKFKWTHEQTWVKISKVMPQSQIPLFPREREGSLTAKRPNLLAKIWYGLTVHIRFFIFKFTSKNFSNLCFVFWQNFQRIIQNSCNSLQNPMNDAKFAPFIDPLYNMLSDA